MRAHLVLLLLALAAVPACFMDANGILSISDAALQMVTPRVFSWYFETRYHFQVSNCDRIIVDKPPQLDRSTFFSFQNSLCLNALVQIIMDSSVLRHFMGCENGKLSFVEFVWFGNFGDSKSSQHVKWHFDILLESSYATLAWNQSRLPKLGHEGKKWAGRGGEHNTETWDSAWRYLLKPKSTSGFGNCLHDRYWPPQWP